jgi:two-component system alkaline phosphatase synthesis response regulator PhoP
MDNADIKILVVDDEADAIEFITYNLRREGYRVYSASNGLQAIDLAKQKKPHLIIMDIMMPELDGIQTCKELRQSPELKDTLIVFLTARSEEFTQVMGLDMGADDYITKPVRPRLLVSKVKSILRRYTPETSNQKTLEVANLVINRESFTLRKNGELIELPRKEFNLIYLLASKPGKVFTREEILSKIWGTTVIVNDRTIDVHIRKLREKIGNKCIKTVKGIGYKFNL